MPAYFDSGMFVRKPAWHMGGNVLSDWPGSFEAARKEAGLEWDIVTDEVFTRENKLISGWQSLSRSDNGAVLTLQPSTYAVISNGEFGNIVEYILEDSVPNLKYETLISIHGGKQIIATMYLDEPMSIPNDPSITLPYLVFISRHDGQGGLKIGPSSVRVVCANTQAMAERQMAKHGFFFTIKHTSNWAQRTQDAKLAVTEALGGFQVWKEVSEWLVRQPMSDDQYNEFLDKWLPMSTDMTDLQTKNVYAKRRTLDHIYYGSVTTEGIRGTKYGVMQAVVELCDHYTRSRSLDTQISRVLGHTDQRKTTALQLLRK